MAENTEIRQETTLRDFLNVVFRRKWVIIAVVGLATLIVVYLNAKRPSLWESSARILVQRGEQSDAFTGHVRLLGWTEEVSSQIEVILSEAVFSGASKIFEDSLRARGLPANWKFQPGLVRADVVGESNAFTIRCTDLNPQIAELGCQAMTMSFQEYYRQRKSPPALSDFFADEITDVRSELDYWENKRNEFLNDEKFFGMFEESRYLLTQIGNMEERMVELESDISAQVSRVENLTDLNQKSGEELESALAIRLSQAFIQSVIIERIKFNLQNLSMRREELMQKYTEKHPEIVAIDSQVADLHEELKQEIENALRIEDQELRALYARKASLNQQLTEARDELGSLPDKDLELNRYDTIISNLRTRYELLLKRQSETEIALAGRSQWEVTVLSNASAPYSKKTHDYVRMALGPFLSIVVALGLAFFLETLDHSVKNTAEAEELLKTPVLATISEVRK
jgi:succinoglycan biosynthesis transport protein ExoP